MEDDDYFGDYDDDALITAATQVEATHIDLPDSPRPTKRRRVSPGPHATPSQARSSNSEASAGEWDPDVVETLDDQLEREANERQAAGKNTRYRVHVPKFQGDIRDLFVTQPPSAATQPHMIRGPIWHKPPPKPVEVKRPTVPPFNRRGDSVIAGREGVDLGQSSIAASFNAIGTASAQSCILKELEDLPSSAFDFSSPAAQPSQRLAAPANGLRQATLFGRNVANVPPSQVNRRFNWPLSNQDERPTHHKLDHEAIQTWIYPINLGTLREYQFNIVKRSLFHNTLVALPTGLGKTFIAATVMLNYFRWTKDAQIVFAAPTRPLVSQQVEACFNIVGIPRSSTTMLTGGISPALRSEEWATKRVFFMTPQTLINDLKLGTCDPKRIVLLVVDEAHRATGSYAYVEVVKFIRRFNPSFRVLALTATPGGDVEAVQKVIDGLGISRIEIRTETSLDIRAYVHERQVEKVVFDNSDEMEMLQGLYSNAVRPVLDIAAGQNAFWSRDPLMLTSFGVTTQSQKWRQSDAGRNAPESVKGMVKSVMTTLASLAHGMEMLKFFGITPFFHSMQSFQSEYLEAKYKSKYKKMIVQHKDWETMMMRMKRWDGDPDFIGHPKLVHLRQTVLNHFMDKGESTRIMVFCHYRGAAEDIVRVLERDKPIVQPHVFVGQANSKNSEGMNQKKQQAIVQDFKDGKINTLIATSIGEEGLDIGEVDLIICYDMKSSPIRMLQRMGRTGRKREGRIVLFQMRGKEENDAAKAKDSYEKMQKEIADGGNFHFHDDRSMRILPKDVKPEVIKQVIEIPLENSQQTQMPIPSKRKKPPKRPQKKFHMPDGVSTGFTTASRMGRDDIDAAQGPREKKPKSKPVVEEEPYPVPDLDQVVLSKDEEHDWELKYGHVDDDDDLLISAPQLHLHPERQRKPCVTKFVSHSSRSLALARLHHPTFNTDVWPTKPEDCNGLPQVELVDDFTEVMRVPDNISNEDEVLPASAHETTDSELEDFIVDDDAPISTAQSSSLPDLSQILRDKARRKNTGKDKGRKNKGIEDREVVEIQSDSDDDLPDPGIVGRRQSEPGRRTVSPLEGAAVQIDNDDCSDVPRVKRKRKKCIIFNSSDTE